MDNIAALLTRFPGMPHFSAYWELFSTSSHLALAKKKAKFCFSKLEPRKIHPQVQSHLNFGPQRADTWHSLEKPTTAKLYERIQPLPQRFYSSDLTCDITNEHPTLLQLLLFQAFAHAFSGSGHSGTSRPNRAD